MLEDLFVFPVILIDGRNEEEKMNMTETERLSKEEDDELDIIYGEAEYPYFDFVGIEDRWLPNKDSFRKALKGKFNGCLVKFNNVGMLLVPWTREKFKTELAAFIEKREGEKEKEEDSVEPRKVTVIKFTPDMLANMIKAGEENQDETKEDE